MAALREDCERRIRKREHPENASTVGGVFVWTGNTYRTESKIVNGVENGNYAGCIYRCTLCGKSVRQLVGSNNSLQMHLQKQHPNHDTTDEVLGGGVVSSEGSTGADHERAGDDAILDLYSDVEGVGAATVRKDDDDEFDIYGDVDFDQFYDDSSPGPLGDGGGGGSGLGAVIHMLSALHVRLLQCETRNFA
jgi:hypothetical protein